LLTPAKEGAGPEQMLQLFVFSFIPKGVDNQGEGW
jgi:hypothetical protein